MQEELKVKLVEVITSIQTSVSKIGDFAIEQMTDIAQQYVLYGIIQSWFFATLFSFISLFALCKFIKSLNSPWFGKYSDLNKNGVVGMCSMFLMLFVIPACGWINNALLVTFAPKIWLLKELANFI